MAKDHLIPFVGYTNPVYDPAPHHTLIAQKLEAVERGDITRLMIFMPPRHGKSELASRRFPAWYLGRNPRSQIIAASYGADLAMDFGREVRNIVASEECQEVFDGFGLRQDSKAAQRWNTNLGGMYIAAGVCGPITGRGADVLLIDDPVKDREEADSEIRRQRVWDWYTSTAYTRLMPGGSIILIQTRWHEDDLAGRLIEAQEQGGDKWEIISLPAINDNNEALWPKWFPLEKLEQIRAVQSTTGSGRDWGALYQQNPTPEEGNFFKRKWIQWYDVPPDHLRYYGASDYATKADEGDYTVHGIAGVDPNDDIYLLDLSREQAESEDWMNEAVRLMALWNPMEWAEESGQIIKSVGPFLRKAIREKNEERKKDGKPPITTYRKPFTSAVDKPTRAQSFRWRMQQGKVYFPKNAYWVHDLIAELMAFPAGKNDDQVDVCALFGRLLDDMIKPKVPGPERPTRFNTAGVKTDLTFNEIRDAIGKHRKNGRY